MQSVAPNERASQILRIGIDGKDTTRFCLTRALYRCKANTTRAKNSNRVTWCTFAVL
jgi:hypothetical protein